MNKEELKSPLVSVIIPTYSRPTNLCRAIDSVLHQTYSNIEIIVVDDNGKGSEFQKRTEEILRDYINRNQIIYVTHETNKNGSAARNTGARLSHGEYIAFLDDDDEFTPEKIELQLERIINTSDDIGGCYCNTLFVGAFHNVKAKNKKEGNLQLDVLLMNANFNSSTLLIKRRSYQELNGFDETFQRHQDWEFLLRFFERYRILLVAPQCYLLIKRVSDECNNIPNPEKAIKYRAYYLRKFQYIIMNYPQHKDICKRQWMDVLILLTISGFSNQKYIKEVRTYIGSYGGMNIKDHIQIIRYKIRKKILSLKMSNKKTTF